MMNKPLVFCFLLFVFQSAETVAQNKDRKQDRKLEARSQINNLRQGVLFVELLDETYLTEVSTDEIKEQVKQRIVDHGESVRKAFEANYRFSDVKYFYRSEYPNPQQPIAEDQITNPSDSEIQEYLISNQHFLIASFRTTPSYEIIEYVNPNAKGTSEQNSNNQYKEYATPKTGLFLTDSDWKIIQKPFPNYVRTTTIFLTQEEIDEAIIKLNKILTKYYNKAN